ncbi:MAG: ArnT family glycosyltransferase [Hyphomicrobiaceae bacterium]
MNFLAFENQSETEVDTWAKRFLVLLSAVTVFRLIALYFNGTDLFFDEAQYWSWSTKPAFGYYSKPPMIAWLIALSTGSCGMDEFCVRLPSPFIHMATASAVFVIGWRLYNAQTGFWSGLVFATLPGVSLSAGIISTDVPLLMFWALALTAFVFLVEQRHGWWPTLALGITLGLGLNSKYAMAYFVMCALAYMITSRQHRHLLRSAKWWLAVALALALITPNLIWNYENSFATFAHTADNAKWHGTLFRPNKALEFFGSQFGVFGPILFAALLIIAKRAYDGKIESNDRLLLAFAVPIIVFVTFQAFVSRAHANWAAPSYVSATVLVTATMIREASWVWLRTSMAIHVGTAVILAVLVATAGSFRLPNGEDPFSRTMGWKSMARAAQSQIESARKAKTPFGSVLTLERAITAELLYYLRQDKTPIQVWSPPGRPRDHFQLTRPYRGKSKDPVLLITIGDIPLGIADHFESIDYLAVENIPAGAGPPRRVTFAKLTGYRP